MFTPVTITGTYENPDGTSANGTITATLSSPLRNGVDQVTVMAFTGVVHDGQFVRDLSDAPFIAYATDDEGTVPTDATYAFVILLDDQSPRGFTCVLPHATSPVDITVLEESGS